MNNSIIVIETIINLIECFLKFLDKQGIGLGVEITIIDIEPFDGSLTIEINNKPLSISNKIASNLYIKKI